MEKLAVVEHEKYTIKDTWEHDIVEYLFKPGYVNEKASELYLRFTTFPAGKFGMALKNSGWVSESYYVDVDTTDALRTFNKDGKASEDLTLRSKMSMDIFLFYFLFDRYHINPLVLLQDKAK